MSKLDELIRELCPDGVEYKRFDEVCTLNARIGWQRLTKAEYMSKGDYLLITGTDFTETHEIDYSTCVYVTEERYKQDPKIQLKNGDILITKDGTLGKVAQVKGLEMPATLNGGVFVVRCKDGSLENRFILHYLLSNHFQSVVEQQKTGSTISHLTQTLFSRLMIPIPPLEIQREIVRILDYYTENVTELQRQLTAELTARKTQYSHYRDKMLTFGDDDKFKWENLGDVCDILTGYPFDSSQFQVSGVRLMRGMNIKRGNLFFSEEINRYWNSADGLEKYLLKENDIVIAMDGSLVGKSFGIVQAEYLPLLLVQRVARIRSEQVNNRYIYHYIACRFPSYVKKKKTGGAIPHVSQKDIASFRVPIPSADVQNRIVNVLDNFEKICSDLNIGLPAEIEARQKQYEYYRDKLLTFAENGNTILSRAEQSRAEQSRAEQSRAEIKLLQYVFGYAVVTLEDIAENCDSMRKPVTSGKREAGEYPYYGASGIVDYVKNYIFDGDYLLVSEDGANLLARSTPIAFSISGKNWVNNHAHVLKFGCYETRRFVEFYLNSIDLAPYISGGAQPKLNQKNLNRIEISLPSQERQKYIVDILDRFDAICNDLTSGLPAEIEARQKQYEYYRDKLLNFKELN